MEQAQVSSLKRTVVVLALILIAACATTNEVVPMGPDTYMVTASSEFGADRAARAAIEEATNFAKSLGLQMVPVSTKTDSELDFLDDDVYSCELVFRLVGEGDPEYRKTNLVPLQKVRVEPAELAAPSKVRTSVDVSELASQLRELKALLDEGILTQEEFDAEKAKVLAGGRD